MATPSVRAQVIEHAEAHSAGPHFWSIPIPAGEPLTHVHIYGHARGHWHYVTDGLHRSLDAIGRGHDAEIELTMRVPRTSDAPLPEPIDVLRRIAFTLKDHQIPAIHDTAVFEPPIVPGSALGALAFVADAELGQREGIRFVQCVGLTAGEARACVRGSTLDVLDRLRATSADLVTDPLRAELGGLPAGSGLPISRGHTVPTLRWSLDDDAARASLELEPTRMRPTFVEHAIARLRAGEPFQVRGPERTVRWERADVAGLEIVREDKRDLLRVFVDAAALEAFARDATIAGDAPLRVGPSEIRFVDEP